MCERDFRYGGGVRGGRLASDVEHDGTMWILKKKNPAHV